MPTMTNVHSFVFPASAGPISIRTVEIDVAPWFVGQDVAYYLGLKFMQTREPTPAAFPPMKSVWSPGQT
ncbi:hypothetical protein [Azospirillum oryzae]|uniref:hypothetical protein n=1 Tax=Azospirillum oryzae TaxID=286727 RepID=UPI001B3BA073|nr:hypothetical protein [Azospirillum oryzae]GLR79557.1 hypothetical protein GCM10007856_22320 [Azospirillum oryzae]